MPISRTKTQCCTRTRAWQNCQTSWKIVRNCRHLRVCSSYLYFIYDMIRVRRKQHKHRLHVLQEPHTAIVTQSVWMYCCNISISSLTNMLVILTLNVCVALTFWLVLHSGLERHLVDYPLWWFFIVREPVFNSNVKINKY